jgi:uncharacterized membrane protein YvbJ
MTVGDSRDPMSDTITCPSCGTVMPSDSKFCRSCGKTIQRCSSCGSQLLPGIMFCPKCEAPVEQASERADGASPEGAPEPPYLVWEGLPFSWLQKTTQTKSQWRMTLWLSGILLATFALILALVFATLLTSDVQGEDELCTLTGVYTGVLLIAVFGLWVRYWTGRRGAEHEESEKWKDR